MSTEAGACRQYVLPKLYDAGWTDDQISQERYFTDGRVIPVGRGHVRKRARSLPTRWGTTLKKPLLHIDDQQPYATSPVTL